MMKRIAPLEISAIRWGMRHEFVSEDVIMEFVKTAARMKLFDIHAFKMLENIYAAKHDRMTLDTICEILLRFKNVIKSIMYIIRMRQMQELNMLVCMRAS